MDWHHPDGILCATDEATHKRFVEYTHGLLRELLTNYGKIDILWYDVDQPLTPAQWEADRMNQMVFALQPEIIVNNRNGLDGDFSTPEHKIQADERAWESCETLNLGWGYQRSDSEWKSPKRILNDLAVCAQQGGNYLLNIGPSRTERSRQQRYTSWKQPASGSPRTAKPSTEPKAEPPSVLVTTLTSRAKGILCTSTFTSGPRRRPLPSGFLFSAPPTVVAVGGLRAKVLSAWLLKTGRKIDFAQDALSLRLTGLPEQSPDDLITVIACECDQPPVVDHHTIRPVWPRYNVGMHGGAA